MTEEQLKAIRDVQAECWRIADEHGWHDVPRSFGDLIALIHSELSETLEAFRGKGVVTANCMCLDDCGNPTQVKPEGVAIELADVVIRVMDMCGTYGIDLADAMGEKMAYNETRPYRHGGKAL